MKTIKTILLTKIIITISVTSVLFSSCKDTLPKIVVSTNEVTNITTTAATLSGKVTIEDYTVVTELGLCWSSSPNPDVTGDHVFTDNTLDIFKHTLTDLQPGTEYHVRAYAFDGTEYHYGEDVCFATLPIGLFTVSKSEMYSPARKVLFSKGNLQYQASTDTWRFAEHPWDYVGCSEPDPYGFTYGMVPGSSNHLIGPDYDGWIDLFGWGTSGHDHGAVCYQPWSTSTNDGDYVSYGNSLNDLFELADWGSNPISNGGNQPNAWRTLTMDEWQYLLNYRPTPSGLTYVDAFLNDNRGIILLPDDWDNSTFQLVYQPYNIINQVSPEDWERMEENGAVFLPLSGMRTGTIISNCDYYGGYWSSSHVISYGTQQPDCALNQRFSDGIDYWETTPRHIGLSVRLVRDYQP